MKPLILFFSLLSCQFLFGQHYFGIKLAPGIQNATFDTGIQYQPTFSMRSGLHYGYRFNEEKPWGFQSGIYYNQRGFVINDLSFQASSNPLVIESADFTGRLNNVGLNLLLKVERKFLYASFGPCFEYNLNLTSVIDYHIESIPDTKTRNKPANFSDAFYFGYEVNLGTQFSLTDKLQAFSELSINQVFSQKSDLTGARFNYMNMNLAFGVNYHF